MNKLFRNNILLSVFFLLTVNVMFSQTPSDYLKIKTQLDSIWNRNQYSRVLIQLVRDEHGDNSKEMNELWKDIKVQDSLNLDIVEGILNKYGWIGADKIGQQANVTFFLVLQNSDITVRQKYLPMLRKAVKKGDALPNHLALMEDIVALWNGAKQIYGTQVIKDAQTDEYYVRPLEDPDNVDARRAEINLPPMKNYLKNWNMVWDPEKYKKDLPGIIEREQVRGMF